MKEEKELKNLKEKLDKMTEEIEIDQKKSEKDMSKKEFLDKLDKKIADLEKKEKKKDSKNEKEIKKLNDKIDSLNKELELEKERVLRNTAELMNFKRRKETEISTMLKYANEDFIIELLPVIDNFERAIKLDDNDLSDEVSKFLSGFKMIFGNLNNILNKFEIREIEALGVEFDPNYHQAVLMEHDDNKPSGVVLEVLQKGYMYKDKVIRPAMVKVNE